MKLPDKSQLVNRIAPLAAKFKRYRVFLFIVTFLGIYAFLIVRINSLTQGEPSVSELNQGPGTIKRLQLDQDSVNKLKELEEQNIEVRALFKQARDNPFTE